MSYGRSLSMKDEALVSRCWPMSLKITQLTERSRLNCDVASQSRCATRLRHTPKLRSIQPHNDSGYIPIGQLD